MASFHADAVERYMSYCANYFVRGGVSVERLPSLPTDADRRDLAGLDGYYGWGGYGGSQMQWHPEEKIAFAFVPNFLFWIDVTNEKGRRLQRLVLTCVRNVKAASSTSEAASASEAASETVSQTASEAVSKTASEAESEAVSQTVSEMASEAVLEAALGAKPEVASETASAVALESSETALEI